MKGRNIIWTGLIALVVGVLMIIYHASLLTSDIVLWCGILFILAGVLNVSLFLAGRDSEGKPSHNPASMLVGWVASAAAVVLGLSMVLFRSTFVSLVGYMFAFLLLFAALYQIFLLIFGARPTRLSPGWYVVPTALIGVAVYVFLQRPSIDDSIILLVTGISFGVFGLACVIEGSQIGATNRTLRKVGETKAEEPATEEVKTEEPKAETPADSSTDETK